MGLFKDIKAGYEDFKVEVADSALGLYQTGLTETFNFSVSMAGALATVSSPSAIAYGVLAVGVQTYALMQARKPA